MLLIADFFNALPSKRLVGGGLQGEALECNFGTVEMWMAGVFRAMAVLLEDRKYYRIWGEEYRIGPKAVDEI
ncbi:MAG: Uncharacterised protein [Cryomorphaceae bacterium]|nr:MAG: Uncharacterised protein [Cryomorphaceae bacterium]